MITNILNKIKNIFGNKGVKKPVVSSIGLKYKSVSEAARHLGVNKSTISRAIHFDKEVMGVRFRFAGLL